MSLIIHYRGTYVPSKDFKN